MHQCPRNGHADQQIHLHLASNTLCREKGCGLPRCKGMACETRSICGFFLPRWALRYTTASMNAFCTLGWILYRLTLRNNRKLWLQLYGGKCFCLLFLLERLQVALQHLDTGFSSSTLASVLSFHHQPV